MAFKTVFARAATGRPPRRRVNKYKSKGRRFEEAVCAFAKTLDPVAEVLFDHKVTDRDTGTQRQCDVWINTSFGGHWPQSILVSCKHHTRRLSVREVGTFCDEVRSTGATMGVLYSKSGFTPPAITKAAANGISCCRLYENEPADLPASIWIRHFMCKSAIELQVSNLSDSSLQTWNDFLKSTVQESNETVLDTVASIFSEGEAKTMSVVNSQIPKGTAALPSDWGSELTFHLVGFQHEIVLRVFGRWKIYRGKVEAHLLNGSYSISNGSFRGSMSGPSIDTWGENLDGWEEISRQDVPTSLNRAIAILWGSDVRSVLQEKLGSRSLSQAK